MAGLCQRHAATVSYHPRGSRGACRRSAEGGQGRLIRGGAAGRDRSDRVAQGRRHHVGRPVGPGKPHGGYRQGRDRRGQRGAGQDHCHQPRGATGGCRVSGRTRLARDAMADRQDAGCARVRVDGGQQGHPRPDRLGGGDGQGPRLQRDARLRGLHRRPGEPHQHDDFAGPRPATADAGPSGQPLQFVGGRPIPDRRHDA